MRRALAACVTAAWLAGPVAAQDPTDPSEILNALLGSLLGFGEVTGEQLQQEVAEVGGVAFRSEVRLDYLTREGLATYLQEVLDSEYPPERAAAEERLLLAFDLLPAGTDLRALRARLLREQVAGFYDERPGRKRLYAVSAEPRLTPANQLILAHELRHALQDQYAEVAGLLPADVGDFDDRRLALMSLLEGDATLVMERFLRRRLPVALGEGEGPELADLSREAVVIPGAAPVLRDQLVQPYVVGRDFAAAVWRQGGWEALRAAWQNPPESTEQVLHPEKFLSREQPLRLEVRYAPPQGRLLDEGVLGELLTRTLLGDETGRAAAGWGGDLYRVWDLAGRTLLVWRSAWDEPREAAEFSAALHARYGRSHGAGRPFEGGMLYGRGRWSVALAADGEHVTLVSSDDAGALVGALRAAR